MDMGENPGNDEALLSQCWSSEWTPIFSGPFSLNRVFTVNRP
jgi:hypothetical protein